jgi:hypothetical protein
LGAAAREWATYQIVERECSAQFGLNICIFSSHHVNLVDMLPESSLSHLRMNEPDVRPRWCQFTLRRMLALISLASVLCVLTPTIWNTRFTAPRRLSVLEPGIVELADTTVYLPIQIETADAYYLLDGGTYGVDFVDARGTRHKVFSWQSLSIPEDNHGDIIVDGWTPDDGGTNIGKHPMGERLIFSVMESIDWSTVELESNTLTAIYPSIHDVFVRRFPRLAFRIGLR